MASFAALLRVRARDLTRHLAAAIRGDIRGVHQGRVASRRLRESLPATGRTRSTARARKSFREVTRALGPVRELDVALAHLETGLQEARVPHAAIDRVRAHVIAERDRRRRRMLAALERVDLQAALDRVQAIAAGGAARRAAWSGPALTRRLHARAAALEAAVNQAGTLYHPEHLHAVRIAGKKLRYALEVVRSASPIDVAGEIRLLKRVQERLGVLHDYQILLEHVEAVADATPPRAPGSAGLRAMKAAYDRECRKLHADYLKMAPGLAAAARKLRQLHVKVRNTTARVGSASRPSALTNNHGRTVSGAARNRRRAR